MPLNTEVGLSPGDTVLEGDPAQQPPPTFWPMSVVAKPLDGSGYHLVGLGYIMLDGDPASS